MKKSLIFFHLLVCCSWILFTNGCSKQRDQYVYQQGGQNTLGEHVTQDAQVLQNLPSGDLSNAIALRKKRVMEPMTYAKLTKVGGLMGSSTPIPDADLNFVLNALKSGPMSDTGDNRLQYYRVVLANVTGKKNLTKSQAGRLIAAVRPLATSSDKDVQLFAIPVLSSTRDARVIPLLEKIATQTDDKRVREAALSQVPRLKELTATNIPAGANSK